MSTQTPRNSNRSLPIDQRSSAQPQAPLTIRVVPFTPPRLSQGSSHTYRAESSVGRYDNLANTGEREAAPGKLLDEKLDPGSALGSSSTTTVPLAGSKGQGVSGSTPASSDPRRPTTTPVNQASSEVTDATNITTINASSPISPYLVRQDADEISSPTSSSTAVNNIIRPLSRNRTFVAVHADKTFSLVRAGPPSSIPSEASRSLISPPFTYSARTSVSSTHEQPSYGAWSEERPSFGTDATIIDRSFSPSPINKTPSPSSSTTELPADPTSASSPWNYRMVGGLRKVAKTPSLKEKTSEHELSSFSAPSTPLPPLPEISVSQVVETPSRSVVPQTSFASIKTSSSVFETANYELYTDRSSPVHQISSDSLALPTSSTENSNYILLGESSPVAPGQSGESSPVVPLSSSRPRTSETDSNYFLHGDLSPSPLITLPEKPRPTYSQESLRVAPLRPGRKPSIENLGYYRQRSRESLRARTGSLKSIKSFSSIISQEAVQAFFAAPLILDIPGLSRPSSGESSTRQPASWTLPGTAAPSSSSRTLSHPRLQMLESTPHQWSSQLSTVMSESEESSTRGASRSISGISGSSSRIGNGSSGHVRRSSGGWTNSFHSRQMPSISSSLAERLEEAEFGSGKPMSRSPSVERPYPTYSRAAPSHARLVGDQDEYGDGLTELHQVSPKPSKSGLSGFFTSTDSSSRNLHSSGSSRANSLASRANSLRSSLPDWARLYYGSGERRLGGSVSIAGSKSSESRPSSAAMYSSASPNTEPFPAPMQTTRKRPHQISPPISQRPFSDSVSMDDIDVMPQNEDQWSAGIMQTIRRKTSSIWSPHLRPDRRSRRYSVWEPPSVNWSEDSGILGKRNAQIVLFIVGFLFPFGKFTTPAIDPFKTNRVCSLDGRGSAASTHQPRIPNGGAKARLQQLRVRRLQPPTPGP